MVSTIVVFGVTLAMSPVNAAVPDDSVVTAFSLSLTQDPAFGFYPSINASVGLSDKIAATFYGVFWTQDALAGMKGGLGLYTEFGAGVGITLFDGALYLAPSVGISSGSFHSGGGRPVFGDGIVPSISLSHTHGRFSFSAGHVEWLKLRNEASITPHYDLYDYYATAGYAFTRHITAGLYFDQLVQTATTECNCPQTTTAFQWIGPFLKITVNSGASLWFSGGIDLVDYRNDIAPEGGKRVRDFYKLQASIPWN
jgi:hypothetical protein